MNAIQVSGFMAGMIIGGPCVLAGVSFAGPHAALFVLALLAFACVLPVLLWDEGPAQEKAPRASLLRFLRRPMSLRMVLVGVVAVLPGAALFTIAPLLLVDAKWTPAAIGVLTGTGHALMVIAGSALATSLLKRYGRWHVLLVGLATLVVASGLWCLIASGVIGTGGVPVWASAIVARGGAGIVTVAIFALAMRYSQTGAQPALDFAALRSAQTLGEILIAFTLTGLAAKSGYLAAAAAVLGLAGLSIAACSMTRTMDPTSDAEAEVGCGDANDAFAK